MYTHGDECVGSKYQSVAVVLNFLRNFGTIKKSKRVSRSGNYLSQALVQKGAEDIVLVLTLGKMSIFIGWFEQLLGSFLIKFCGLISKLYICGIYLDIVTVIL